MRFGRRAAVAVSCGLLLSFATGETRSAKATKTISGVVNADEVHRAKVVSVFIMDDEKNKFLVVRGTEKGKELLAHVGATVQATGYVRKGRPDGDYPYMIDVVQYEVVTPAKPKPPKARTNGPKSDST